MNNLVIVAIVAVLIIGGAFVFLQNSSLNSYRSGTPSTGNAVFSITDAAGNLSGVSSIQLTIQSIEVQSANQGWVVVSTTPRTVDLLALNATSSNELLANVQLNADTYEQIRLNISQLTVVDSNGTHVAKLPSGELKIVGNLTVTPNSTSTALFDFIAGESLHLTGNGEYIFAPVVHLQTRENANVTVDSQNNVTINNGIVDTDEKVGMDANGNVGMGLEIPQNEQLSINANGKIGIGLS